MRIRLEFDGGRLLTKEQRLSGLRRCWFLINPEEIATVADLASELFRRFCLQRNCPDGVFFSMDGFVIPPCESTSFFREKDIVSVHKRTCKKKKMITRGDDRQPINRAEIVEKEPVPFSNGMLAIESRETIEMRNNRVMREGNCSLQTQLVEMGSKRKHNEIEKPESSKKKKKPKLTTVEKPLVINGSSCEETQEVPNQQSLLRARTPEQISHEKANLSDDNEASPMTVVATDNADVSNETSQIIPERNIQVEENCNPNIGGPNSGDLPKKLPSRSARRKYAQRKLKKELKKRATENMQSEVLLNGTDELATENHVVPAQERTVTHNSVVAKVDRPGHIRFESEGEDGDDDDGLTNVQPNEPPMECFQWNGITNKTKGQKWGQDMKYRFNASRYNTSSDWRDASNEDSFPDEKFTEKSTSNVGKAPIPQVNFESLSPLTRSPKEGDLIVYRVVELSSTWCPDLSPFRVGEVQVYNLMSDRILLAPVPEYPIFSDREGDDANKEKEDAPYQDDLSLYKEDGSLEIEFTSLVDVRLLRVNGSVSPSTSSVSRKMNSSQAAMKKDISLVNRLEMAAARSSADDVVNPISTEGSKDAEKILFLNNNRDVSEEAMHDQTGTKPNSKWEANGEVENARNTQARQNGWDMAAKKHRADDLVKPTSTEGCRHVERSLFSDNNWEVAVQNDPEESIHNTTGAEPNSNWETNDDVANAGNTAAQQNGWEKWTPNTSTPSWSYRALRGSALGPTIAWLRGNDGNATTGYGGRRGRGGDGGRRGRGRGGDRSRGGGWRRGRGNYGMPS